MSINHARTRRHHALLLVGCLATAIAGVVANPAEAGKPSPTTTLPTPTQIVVTGVTSDFTRAAEFPGAAPSVLVAAGGTIRVSVRFEDANHDPAAFKKDTQLTVTSNVGTLGTTTGTALKGESTATVLTSVTAPVNQVVLTVSAGTGPKAPTPGQSVTFDVVSELEPDVPASNGVPFEEGIGGDAGCTTAEPSAPVCGIVQLPRGAGSNVVLSVGACDPVVDPDAPRYAPCYAGANGPGGAVVQSLFTQPSQHYTVDSPATIILKCDKTLCGTGSIQALTVLYSLTGNQPLTAPAACPAKGVMAEAGQPCIDYVQSKRDGSGDTHLYLLTDRDIRTGIG